MTFALKTQTKFRWARHWRHFKERHKKKLRRRESVFLGSIRIAGGDEEVAEFLWTHLENAQIIEIPFFLVYGALAMYFVHTKECALCFLFPKVNIASLLRDFSVTLPALCVYLHKTTCTLRSFARFYSVTWRMTGTSSTASTSLSSPCSQSASAVRFPTLFPPQT